MSDPVTDLIIEDFLAKFKRPPVEERLQQASQALDQQIKRETHATRKWLIVYVGSMLHD